MAGSSKKLNRRRAAHLDEASVDRKLSRQRAADLDEVWVEPTSEAIDAHADMYEIAFKEATRTLDDQVADVGNARTRAVQYLAFVGAATSFLAGTAIRDVDPSQRSVIFYIFAIGGSVLALAALLCIAALLNPWQTSMYKRIQPKTLIVEYIERDLPLPNKAEMWRELSFRFDEWQELNEHKLIRVRILYAASIVLGGLQLVAWASLVWVAG